MVDYFACIVNCENHMQKRFKSGASSCSYIQFLFNTNLIYIFNSQSMRLPLHHKNVIRKLCWYLHNDKTSYHHLFKQSQDLFFRGDLWWKLLKLMGGGWWRNGPISSIVFRMWYGWPFLFTTRNPNTGKSVQLSRQRKHN